MKKRIIFVCFNVLAIYVFFDQLTYLSQRLSRFESPTSPSTTKNEPETTTDDYMDIKPRFHKKRRKYKGLMKIKTKATEKVIEDAKMHRDAVLKSLDQRTNISMHNPKRIVIVSTWRSGSTFLADLIHSLPPTWYHYEPLNVLGVKQVRSKEEPAVSWINSLIHCNYTHIDKYIDYLRTNPDLYYYNKEWRTICKSKFNSACLHSHVLQKMCSLYPIQVLKTVRIRLRLLQNLLEDPSIKIIYLVRDPRGTIQSRKHREWCPTSPDCFKSELLCSDLVDDYQTAVTLRLKYPNQFIIIRYEVFSSDVAKSSKNLFKDLSLPWHTSVEDFIKKHTKLNFGGPWSTYRNSKAAPFHWIHELTKVEVNRIQARCARPLKMWGYRSMNTSNPSKSPFNPVIDSWSM